jgi:hypothetical protein
MSKPELKGVPPVHADFVVRDRDGQVVLLGEVKAPKSRFISEQPDSRLFKWASEHPDGLFPYLMVANANSILIFRQKSVPDARGIRPGESLSASADCSFNAGDILTAYDPSYREKAAAGGILEPYLTGLITAWLRDLAYHWKSEKPPGADELNRIGLASRLEGGWAEEDRDDDPLR